MKVNVELLKKNIEDGFVISQKHPTLDLTIYNYSKFAQYENHWDEITLMCRGLILDSEYNIIQRPFEKFFNMDELISEYKPDIPNLPFDVFDKMDGSLGILYWDGDTPKIASRGSFISEQALMGTEMLDKYYRHTWGLYDKSKTYVFEIIYPENRIVVDYGEKEALVLLGIIDIETGEDISLDTISPKDFHVVEKYDGVKDFDKLKALDIDNKEGFVIRFENGFRMKLKFDEYCRLHKIITNVTSYDIWECLRFGTGLDEILNKVPDEFYEWVRETTDSLETQFHGIADFYKDVYAEKGIHIESQKEFAEWAKTFDNPGLLFNLRSDKDIKRFNETIWKMIKPKFEKPFSKKSEKSEN